MWRSDQLTQASAVRQKPTAARGIGPQGTPADVGDS